jgi:hypothetical protein
MFSPSSFFSPFPPEKPLILDPGHVRTFLYRTPYPQKYHQITGFIIKSNFFKKEEKHHSFANARERCF